jgi:lipoyl(octanoyl) transferase
MRSLHEQVVLEQIPNQLMLLEHEPVITITRQHMRKSLKTSEADIRRSGIALAIADRGGDATFHGPGQLVGYPILSLKTTKGASGENPVIDISRHIRSLEQALLSAVQSWGISSAELLPGFTGIWIKYVDQQGRLSLKKLVAIGVGVKDGVSKHGFAMNIDIDAPRYLEHMVPCGLKDRGVITLKEVFCLERLEIPKHSAIVKTVSECLSKTFSLTLKWRS